jgi:hypothetical protein
MFVYGLPVTISTYTIAFLRKSCTVNKRTSDIALNCQPSCVFCRNFSNCIQLKVNLLPLELSDGGRLVCQGLVRGY